MNEILNINAHLKYVEFLLYIFDYEKDDLTLGEIRKQFFEKFGTNHDLLNQNFGIYRLLSLILIKEEYKNQKVTLEGDIQKIKIIRDAIAHHKFTINEQGYTFTSNSGTVSLNYDEFQKFIHKIENDFYGQKLTNQMDSIKK
ncbi:hypothetical protein KKA17_11670 [bacterium]|nr:hypothetical protein [bacterium]MBU1883670.1 hypothetical protein [bacterium]